MAFGVCTNFFSSFPPSTGQKWKITSHRLLDQRYIGGNATYPPHFGPFWAFSRTLPQGVELLV